MVADDSKARLALITVHMNDMTVTAAAAHEF